MLIRADRNVGLHVQVDTAKSSFLFFFFLFFPLPVLLQGDTKGRPCNKAKWEENGHYSNEKKKGTEQGGD